MSDDDLGEYSDAIFESDDERSENIDPEHQEFIEFMESEQKRTMLWDIFWLYKEDFYDHLSYKPQVGPRFDIFERFMDSTNVYDDYEPHELIDIFQEFTKFLDGPYADPENNYSPSDDFYMYMQQKQNVY